MLGLGIAVLLAAGGALDTNEAHQQGVALYSNLEFEQALFRFEEAALSADLSNEERSEVFVWMAMSYAGLGKEPEAKRSLRDALRRYADPPVPAFAPPKIAQWLKDARAEVKQSEGAPPAEVVPTTPTGPTSEVEVIEVKPEGPSAAPAAGQTEEPTSYLGLVFIGGGVVGMLAGAAIAGLGGVFWYDYYNIQANLIPQQGNADDVASYEQAAFYDIIIGTGMSAVGLFIMAAGGGTIAYGAIAE